MKTVATIYESKVKSQMTPSSQVLATLVADKDSFPNGSNKAARKISAAQRQVKK